MSELNDLTEVRFHFASLKFTPYQDKATNSNQILRDILNFIRAEKNEKRGVLINRHETRDSEPPRELFVKV